MENNLERQLLLARTSVSILEMLIKLKCEIRDEQWRSPKGFPLAMSFEVFGGINAVVNVGAACFIVYGHNAESIKAAALGYASLKYGADRIYRERCEDLEHIGRLLLKREKVVEVVGIYPKFFDDEGKVEETVYVCEPFQYLRLSEVAETPDFDWENSTHLDCPTS